MYAKRIRAGELRKRGKSINYIAAALAVSKGTASIWCRDVVLTVRQRYRLNQSMVRKTSRGRLMGALTNKQKRLTAIKEGEVAAKKIIRHINTRELVLISTALYWSEGAKSSGSSGFQFVNSDPEMILMIKQFLLHSGVKNEDLVCAIQINEIHRQRIQRVLSFWKNLLNLQDEQIRKPYFVKTKTTKIYENYNKYFGICRLKVRRSTVLKYKMLGLIKALKSAILPT